MSIAMFFGGKRGILTLLGLITVSTICMAQVNFVQRGNASQEMQADGLRAAHHSLPFGTGVQITNLDNDMAIEVMVSGRIPASPDRIIDLSRDAALALGIGPGETMQVLIHGPSQLFPAAEPEPPVQTPIPPQSVLQPAPQPEPEPLLVQPPQQPQPEPALVALSEPEPEPEPLAQPQQPLEPEPSVAIQSPGIDETQSGDDIQPHVWLPLLGMEPKPAQPLGQAREIRVIPNLPDPNSAKLFVLQVGAFNTLENADYTYRLLYYAGLNPRQEGTGGMYRVSTAGIPASNVYSVIQQIGLLGITEVWVREQ